MAINLFGNLPPLLQEDPLTKIQQSTLAFGEQPPLIQGNPYSPVENQGLRNAYIFGAMPNQPAAAGPNAVQPLTGQGDGQGTVLQEPDNLGIINQTMSQAGVPQLGQQIIGAVEEDRQAAFRAMKERQKREAFNESVDASRDALNRSYDDEIVAEFGETYGIPNQEQLLANIQAQAAPAPQETGGFFSTLNKIFAPTETSQVNPFGAGKQFTPREGVTPAQELSFLLPMGVPGAMPFDERKEFAKELERVSESKQTQPSPVLPEVAGKGTVMRDTQAGSPQATFLARKEKGPLSDYEIEQAKLYAASMGTTFDPEAGYGQKGSAPVMDRGVAATRQALLRQFGAPTISQIQELDSIDRERQRGPEQPLDEREQRMVQQQQLRKAFGGNVPSRLIGQTGQIEAPTSANIPSEISEIMLKPAQMRTDDERNRLARFGRSSMGQAIGGLSGLEAAMLSPAERAAAAAKATQANLTTQTKQVQLESAKLELDQLRNPQVDPVKATQINSALESLGVDRIGEGGLTVDDKGNLRTPTEKLKPGSREYNTAVSLLNQTEGGKAILGSLDIGQFAGFSVAK